MPLEPVSAPTSAHPTPIGNDPGRRGTGYAPAQKRIPHRLYPNRVSAGSCKVRRRNSFRLFQIVLKNATAENPETGLEDAYAHYRQELQRFFALRARESHAADDLVQLVYLRLLRARPTEVIRDPRLYVYKIAWNVLRKDNQRVQREQQRTVRCDADQLEQLAHQLGNLWIDNSGAAVASDQVETLLRQLPPAYQAALVRHYRDGRTYGQIADELGVTTHTVKKYIVRGLATFRAHFNPTERSR
jgi:RNA polymerase sigma factor (sigma-70 family)